MLPSVPCCLRSVGVGSSGWSREPGKDGDGFATWSDCVVSAFMAGFSSNLFLSFLFSLFLSLSLSLFLFYVVGVVFQQMLTTNVNIPQRRRTKMMKMMKMMNNGQGV